MVTADVELNRINYYQSNVNESELKKWSMQKER